MNTEHFSKPYELPTESLPTLDYSCHLADLIKFKEFVETRGVSTKNTRIDRYIQCLNEVVSKKCVNEPSIFKNSREKRFRSSLDWQLYVLRDVTRVAFEHNGLTIAVTPEHSKDINQDKLKSIAGSVSAAVETSGVENFIRCWFQIHIASLVANPPCVSSRVSSYSIDDFAVRKDTLPALILLRVISAVGDIPDARANAAQKLKIRTGVHLPAGATFRPVELRIAKELLENGCMKSNPTDKVIGMLEFNGVKHEFIVRDLLCLFAVATASDKEDMVKEDMGARVELLLKMFMLRYPYENVASPSFGLPLDIDRHD